MAEVINQHSKSSESAQTIQNDVMALSLHADLPLLGFYLMSP